MDANNSWRCPLTVNGVRCPGELEPDMSFCPKCGNPAELPPCSRCQTPVRPGSNFCSKCGVRLSHKPPSVFQIVPSVSGNSDSDAGRPPSECGAAARLVGESTATTERPALQLVNTEIESVASSTTRAGRKKISASQEKPVEDVESVGQVSMPSAPSIDSGFSKAEEQHVECDEQAAGIIAINISQNKPRGELELKDPENETSTGPAVARADAVPKSSSPDDSNQGRNEEGIPPDKGEDRGTVKITFNIIIKDFDVKKERIEIRTNDEIIPCEALQHRKIKDIFNLVTLEANMSHADLDQLSIAGYRYYVCQKKLTPKHGVTSKEEMPLKLAECNNAIKLKGEWHQYDYFLKYEGFFGKAWKKVTFAESDGEVATRAIQDLVTDMMERTNMTGETLVLLLGCLRTCITSWKSLEKITKTKGVIIGDPIMRWIKDIGKKSLQQRRRGMVLGMAAVIMHNDNTIRLTAQERITVVNLFVPSTPTAACEEVESLRKIHFKKPWNLCQDLQNFVSTISAGPHILTVVPLLHFLGGESKPYGFQKDTPDLEQSYRREWWGISSFGEKFIKKIEETCRNIKNDDLQDVLRIFGWDPLLSRTMVASMNFDASHKTLKSYIPKHEVLCAAYHQIYHNKDNMENFKVYLAKAKRTRTLKTGTRWKYYQKYNCQKLLLACVNLLVNKFKQGDQVKVANAICALFTSTTSATEEEHIPQNLDGWFKTIFPAPVLNDAGEDDFCEEFFESFNSLLKQEFQTEEHRVRFRSQLSACLDRYLYEGIPQNRSRHLEKVLDILKNRIYSSEILTMIQDILPDEEEDMKKEIESILKDQQKRQTRLSARLNESKSRERDDVSIRFHLIVIGKKFTRDKISVEFQSESLRMEECKKVKRENELSLWESCDAINLPKNELKGEAQYYKFKLESKEKLSKEESRDRLLVSPGRTGVLHLYDTLLLGDASVKHQQKAFIFLRNVFKLWMSKVKKITSHRDLDHELVKLEECMTSWSILDEKQREPCFKEALMEHLSERANDLAVRTGYGPKGCHEQAMAIIQACDKYGVQLPSDAISAICKALLPQPKEKHCYGECKGNEFEMITKPLVNFIEKGIDVVEDVSKILYCIPFLHFVLKEGELSKHTYLQYGESKWWGIEGLEGCIDKLQDHFIKQNIKSDVVLTEMKEHFQVDRLLPRTILRVLGPRSIPDVVVMKGLPLDAVLGTVAYHTSKGNFNPIYLEDVCDRVDEILNSHMESAQPNELRTSSEVALELIQMLTEKTSDHQNILTAIKLPSMLIEKMVTMPKLAQKANSLMSLYLECVADWLSKWLSNNRTNHEEFRVWQYLLNINIAKGKENDKWQETIKQKLKERNNQRSNQEKISMYIDSDTFDIRSSYLRRHIEKAAYKATEEEMKIEDRGQALFSFTKSGRYAHMMSLVWTKSIREHRQGERPRKPSDEIFRVLKQPFLLEFLKLYASDQTRNYLNAESSGRLKLTANALATLHEQLKQGSINKDILEEVGKMKESIGYSMKCAGLLRKTEDETRLSDLIREGQNRMAKFENHRENVATLLMFLRLAEHGINADEILELEKRFATRYQDKPLNHLISNNDQTASPGFYNIPSCLNTVLPQLNMLKECRVFKRIWKDNLCHKHIGLAEISERIWAPSKAQWEEARAKLEKGTIELCAVDTLFEGMTDQQVLLEIKKMLPKDLDRTVRERLDQIQIYRQVSEQAYAAKKIMDVKHAYNLEGDFNVIEKLMKMTSLNDTPLSSMTTGLLDAGKLLARVTDHEINCIDAFTHSFELVQWIRKEVPRIDQLTEIIDRGLIAADCQGDLEVIKVTCLDDAVRGFAPLIYGLNSDAGFEDFHNLCKNIWPVLEKDEALPEKLKSVNQDIEWLNRLKTIERTVEVSTLQEVDAINKRGIYRMGRKGGTELKLENIIHVEVPEEVGVATKRSYTFNDLRVLQSKLMLIAGKEQKQKHDFTRFVEIFDAVTLLARTFIDICTSGSILFKDWSAQFHCNEEVTNNVFVNFGLSSKYLPGSSLDANVTQQITQIREFMEECRDEWKDYINQKRLEFPELNHYTTEQLVMLRSSLADMVANKRVPSPHILELLHDVHPYCNIHDLQKAIRDAFEEIKEAEGSTFDNENQDSSVEKMEKDPVIKELLDEGFSLEIIQGVILKYGKDKFEIMEWRCQDSQDKEDKKKKDFKSVQEQYTLSDKAQTYIHKLQNREPLRDKLKGLWEEFLSSTKLSVSDYLSVGHLGIILQCLKDRPSYVRTPPTYLKVGHPNLIVCPQNELLQTVLSLYMGDKKGKAEGTMPTREEVLLCTEETTAEEVELLLLRAIQDDSGNIYTLGHADQLKYDVAVEIERAIEKRVQGQSEYRFVVICSAEGQDRSLLIGALSQHRVNCAEIQPLEDIKSFIQNNLGSDPAGRSNVDPDGLAVRVVTSNRAGNGKTLWMKRCRAKLAKMHGLSDEQVSVSIPLFGRSAKACDLLKALLPNSGSPAPRMFHIDIQHEVNQGVDHLLFNLVFLGSLVDPAGYIWRRSNRDLYVIEIMPLINWEVGIKEPSDVRHHKVHRVLDLLPEIQCHSPRESLKIMKSQKTLADIKAQTLHQVFDLETYEGTTYQRVNKQLMELAMPSSGEKSSTEKKTSATKPHPRQTLPGGGHKRPLQSYSLEDAVTSLETSIRFCGHLDPTWSELEYFIRFLSKQLEMCENSIFLKEDIVGDTLPNFENFVTRFMIQMSKDFSTRSLEMAEESPTPGDGSLMDKKEDEVEEEDELSRFQLKRRWESSPHPYIFFNPDATMTFLGFTIDKNKMNLVDPDTHAVLQEKIIDEDLYNGLRTNGVDLSENSDKKKNPDEIRKAQLEKLCKVMGNEKPPEKDPDPNYVLTSDNVKKMMAIQMRFRCRIPVIVMGETGCGKTYLIRFMCSLQNPGGCECKNMTLMKIHGGTTQEEVIKKIKDTEQLALKNRETFPHMYTVLFLDEVNTTESLAIVKEAMCDGSINGRPLEPHSGLRLIAACNPYRRHSQEVVDMLEKAGLGYHVGANSTKDTLGRIPMRRLVYRVQPLPQSMLPLVWDFGQIQKQAEKLYIEQIVAKKLYQMTLRERDRRRLRPVLTDILVVAQKFMREQGDACSFVSLRDVERTMTVFEWFYTKGDILYGQMKCSQPPVDDLVRSIMLALGVCYFVSLQQKRTDFLKVIESCFAGLWKSTNWEYDFKSVVESCQNLFLEHMVIGENIARNKALKENVYIMIVCIELRIPLFLVGKPGCSKSLAKNIVLNNMDGSYPKKNVLKTFKKVHMASYQCSQLSTSEGIISIFRQCASYQKERELEKHTAVVVLDEVGLAEDSDKMPLKALHSLLEDGSHEDEVIEKYKKVGFIGISNWALDPAKMNRGILVQRGVPDVEELTKTAKGISSGVDRSIAENMDPLMKPLALAYFSLHDEAIEMKREFFGLRDFYSLVKMVYCFAEAKRDKPTWPQIEHAILRNFGGLNNVKAVDTFDHFLAGQIDKKRAIDDCDNSPRGLLSSSLEGNKKWNTRYLLLMTESHVALPIIQRNFDCIGNALVIYGSAFPKDQDYTVVCRNINRIKMCMEAGQPVILIHLENLYEALYDLLNMHHANYGGVQLVDIGLGTHRMKTRIEKGFRIYVVAEKEHVYKNFPIPLINRLEKHIVDLSTFLTGKHDTIIRRLDRWMEQFISQPTPISSSSLDRKDVFIGFHDDAPISLVSDISWSENQVDDEAIEKVLKEAQLKLLQCATPEAIVRTAKSTLVSGESVLDVYFKEQEHDSLKGYLMKNFVEKTPSSNRFLQVTTYSNLLSRAALTELTCCINECHSNIELTVHNLQTFETEQQFSNVMRKWFDDDGVEHQIFIVQCESGDQNQKLIACARHIIHAEQRSVAQDGKTQPSLKHVILIVKIPRVKGGCFNGFEGGLWESLHLDDLAEQQHIVPPIYKLMELTVSDLLAYGVDMSDPNQQADPTHRYEEQFDLTHLVYLAVHGASSMMRNETDPELTTRIVRYMMDVFSRSDIKEDSQTGFRQTIKQRLQILMADREINTMLTPRNWLVKNVASVEAITKAGTLRRSLWLYLESKITLLLAGLIAHFNTNNNMKLIMKEVQEKWITDMWIQMAQAPEITSLEYADLKPNKDGEELKEIVVRMIGCQCMNGSLPFSWIIKDKLDQIIENHIQGEHHEDISWISDVARVLTKMPLWLVLQTAFQNAGREKVKDCYLQDFVRMIYKPKSKDTEEEYELVKLAIDSTMRGMMPRMVKKPESDDSESLKDEEVLLLIHAAELEIRGRLQLFSQVLECLPETIKDITKAMQNGDEDDLQDISDASEMTLDILTVHLVVNSVQPEKKVLRNLERSRNWLMNMEKLAPLINDVLARSETIQHSRGRLYGEKWALARIRTNWNRVYAVKMCADIICPLGSEQEEDITKTCPNLWKKLENSDFKSKSTMAKVLEVLELATEITCRNYEEYIPKCLGCDKTLLESFHLPCGDDVCVTCTKDLIAGGTFECLECKKSFKEEEAVLTNHGEREAKAKAEAYKGRCRTFFVEIVSRMCFAEDITPDESVVQMLLEFITAKQTEEPLETPIVDIRLDLTTQVLRSVFIQLLLQKSPQAVGIHLKTFFESQADTFEDLSKDLAIIYSQCLEDNIHNLMANESKDFLLGKAIQLLQEGLEELNKEFTLNEELLTTEQDISDVEDEPTLKETAAHDEQENSMKIVLENIEGVAYTRLGLDYAASVMHRINVDGDEDDNELIVDLFKSAEMLCEKTVAAAYLTRVIARRYGQDVLLMIQRQWPWVIPEYALPNENSKTPDRLIVCGEDYKKTRECVALYLTNLDTQPVKELFDAVQNVEERRNLLLSIYREITSSHFHPQNASISQEAMAGIKTILQGKPTYKDMDLAVALLDNALHVNCPGLKVSPETSHSVLDIIVHFGLSMATLPEGGPTGLFKLLVSNPASLKGCFLPTMPEDNRAEFYETIRQAAAVSNKYDNSTLYECENGHPYVIENCGQAVYQRLCPTCGITIGGQHYTLAQRNVKLDRVEDTTKPGHCLGQASERGQVIELERDLTPASTALLRLFVHLALYVGANTHLEAVQELITPELENKDEVPDFLWLHIIRDLKQIETVTGKSNDECALLVHLLIHNLLISSVEGEIEPRLKTKNSRRAWENLFDSTCIKPVIKDIDQTLLEANQRIIDDNRVGSRAPMLKIIHETEDAGPVHNITQLPAMWRYRARVTLENLAMKLSEERRANNERQYCVLELFLKKERQLRVVQHLPNIVRFVLMASQYYHRKAGRDIAEADTVEDYIQNIQKESKQTEARKLFQEVCEAWKYVQPHLNQHGSKVIPERYCRIEMTEETPITALLPNDRGKGLCITGLLHYLMSVHNEFVNEFCHLSHNVSGRPEVSLKEVNQTHLISYHPEQDLLPLISAHCNYSLEVRHGTRIEYNFASLEQNLKDRFIAGKAQLKFDIENVIFCEDLNNAKQFQKLQRKIPQSHLEPPVMDQICKDFRYMNELDDCLSNLDKTIGFLVTIGGKPDMFLRVFMADTLCMDESVLTRKARQLCRLKHIRALWLLLSLEREKLVAKHKQESFTTVDASKYKKPLDPEQKRELEHGLQQMSCDLLLARLYEFIVLHVKPDPHDEDYVDNSEQPLCMHLDHYLEDLELPEIPALNDGTFPESILVDQSVETWLAINAYTRKKK